MRVIKEPGERMNEILDAAEVLFLTKGFDGTSTQDILEKVQIARGTLYYHFKSKEDIMDALIDRINTRLLKAARSEAVKTSIPVKDRIINVVMSMQVGGGSEEVIMDHIHKPQNALLHQKIQKVILCGVTPIMADLIREGIDQGIFHTPYPYECMEMVIAYTNAVFDSDMIEFTREEMAQRIEAFIFNLERLLGVERGELQYAEKLFEGGH